MNNFLNEVTLDCLMNKSQYDKYVANKNSKKINKKDRKFYKKRIFNLTRELLLDNDISFNLFPDIKIAFDNYINLCIHYFKNLDNNDIIQEEYI